MNKTLLTVLLLITVTSSFAQQPDPIINAKEVERIENVLASDEMRGRATFSPEIDKAADFISSEFKAAGLQPFSGNDSYLQRFIMVRPAFVSAAATLDGTAAEQKNIFVITCQPEFKIDQSSGYALETIPAGANLTAEAGRIIRAGKNAVVMVDESHASNFNRIGRFKRMIFKTDKSFVFILGNKKPATYSVEAKHTVTEMKLANVAGVLPGKSKKEEFVVFSGHYDHVGVAKQAVNGDSIFNGANDDAAGTAAVILLARHFAKLKNNERTLVFVAFTAEEIGGFGSQYFSQQMDPAKVMAMFNIEMIGTESKWGKNSAYITGFERTDMGAILQKNLEGTGFTFHPDPYPSENLFFRSDNATLARLGVPAHTISTSKMDSEPNYHKVTDEVKTLDLDNMAMIIQSIALSAKGIISGKETPSRVKVDEL